ncbi:MAG: trigger factor [Elusimicrobia bacterium]|nr:trigger factor [Elusimicrobiota bacterium]
MENAKISDIGKTVKQIEFLIDEENARKSRRNAINKIKNGVKVPGFRVGKTPDDIIERNFAEDVKSEQEKIIISSLVSEFLDKNGINPVAPVKLRDFKWKESQPEKFTVEVEILPEFKAANYRKIPIKIEKKEISDETVDKAVENLRERAFTLEEAQKTKPDIGDFVKHDLTVISDGKVLEKYSRKNLTAELAKAKIMPALWPDILDAEVNKEKDIGFTADKNFPQKELAGKKLIFRIKINKIYKKILPPLDDKFAKMFGTENIAQLRETLKKRLETEAEIEKQSKMKEQIIDWLIRKNSFEIPESMIEEEKKSIAENLKKQYGSQAVEKEMGEIKKRAEENIKIALILGKIAKQEKIEVPDEEIRKRLGKKWSSEKAKRLGNELLTEKIFDFIIKEAKIK